jgi:hypothetical protein
MKKIIALSILILAGCATDWTPKVIDQPKNASLEKDMEICKKSAYEAAGNALDSTTQMAHDEVFERRERQMLYDPIGLLPQDGQVLSGEWSGPNSETPYKGPNGRQAYTNRFNTCLIQRGYKLAAK